MTALLPIILVLFVFVAYLYITRWRAQRLRSKPFPPAWLAIIEASLPVYPMLSQEEQDRLCQLVKLFIAKKRFYGCGGVVITDEIRVTIAAQACLLLLNKGWSVYPKLTAILVYPSAFRVDRDEHQADGTVVSGSHGLLGESWHNGRVILSWDDVERGVSDFSDGHNVVLHEFSHQLDAESGSMDGAPALRSNSYQSWAKVFSENFEDLKFRYDHGQSTVIDEYGTTNPAEFFAVATETFFEKPHQLHRHRPELYQELSHFYQLDPMKWSAGGLEGAGHSR
ncbi:MAG: zinc-dependent peptidase [Halioglobus sp.]|nr:zinc-dependent peptidase [Halioglobus sp.]